MKDQILEVLKKIESFGYQAYVVGGYVRDLYLGKPNKDIDICTNATPDQIAKIFQIENKDGIKYGSVVVEYNNYKYDVTTFRKEKKYKNNRLPLEVKYIDSLKEDLKRRDFTINTLCLDSKWNIIDIMGGKKDIEYKIINTVGNSNQKIKQDCLRILRAIRFATILNFELSYEIKQSIKKYKGNLKKISYERKKEELDKIFNSSNVLYGISLMKELKLMEILELSNDEVKLSNNIGFWFQLDKNLKYPYTNDEKNILKDIKELLNENFDDKYVLYKYNIENILITARIRNMPVEEIKLNYSNLKIKSRKDIKIDGYKICEIVGIDKRSIIKDIYENLEKKILYGIVNNDPKSIKDFLTEEYKNL